MYIKKEFEYEVDVKDMQRLRQVVYALTAKIENANLCREEAKGAKKRPFTKQITQLACQLDRANGILENAPPRPLSDEKAIQIMVNQFQSHFEDYDELKSATIRSLNEGNLHWTGRLKELLALEYTWKIISPLYELGNFEEMFNRLIDIHDEISEDVFQQSVLNSTDNFLNAVNFIIFEEKRSLVKFTLKWWLKSCEQINERVKVWQEIQEQ